MPNLIKLFEINVENFQGGRLKFYLEEWKQFSSDSEILNTVAGLEVEYEEITPQEKFRESRFSYEEEIFLDIEIDKLLRKGASSFAA